MPTTIRSFLSISKMRENPIAIISFLLVAALVSVSIIAAARLESSGGSHQSPSAVQRHQPVQIVSFTLYDTGIYPQEARANPGAVTITIEDLTASSSGLIVELVNERARARAGVIDKAIGRLRARAELNLVVGRYELVDATRPENRALLIVDSDRQ